MKKNASRGTKRFLGAVLAIALMMTMLQVPAFAAETKTAHRQQHTEACDPTQEGCVQEYPADRTKVIPDTGTSDDGGTASGSQDADVPGQQPDVLPSSQIQAWAVKDSLTWSGPINYGYHLHYYGNSNLPSHFAECVNSGISFGNPGGAIDLYYDKANYSTIYCTEVNNGVADASSSLDTIQSQQPTPNMVGKEHLIRYILARGQQMFQSDWNSMELQMATQIAIWCVAEDVTSEVQLDAILYPVTATQSDKAHFAPTLEVGRLARGLLDGARENANKPAAQTIPSFASLSEASAAMYTMQPDGNTFKIALDDANNILAYDWGRYITVKDAAGLGVSVTGNTMTITGNPGVAGRTLRLENAVYSGSVYYVASDMHPDNDPNQSVQKMVRFVGAVQGITPLYLKVNGGTDPNVPNDETGSLSVAKTFADPGENQAVTFTVTKGNALVDLSRLDKTVSGSGSFAWITDGTDGKFTLAHDTSVMFGKLAPGTYVVTEDVPSGFEAPDVAVSGGAGSKNITNGAEIVMSVNDPIASAAFTNKKVSAPATNEPAPAPNVPAPSPSPAPAPAPTNSVSGPKTGDTSNITLWIVVMAVSVLGLGIVLRRARCRNKQ